MKGAIPSLFLRGEKRGAAAERCDSVDLDASSPPPLPMPHFAASKKPRASLYVAQRAAADRSAQISEVIEEKQLEVSTQIYLLKLKVYRYKCI